MPCLLENTLIKRIPYDFVGYCTEGSSLGVIIIEYEVVGIIFSRGDFAAVFADEVLPFRATGDLKGDIELSTSEDTVIHLRVQSRSSPVQDEITSNTLERGTRSIESKRSSGHRNPCLVPSISRAHAHQCSLLQRVSVPPLKSIFSLIMAARYSGTSRPTATGRASTAGPSRRAVATATTVPDYEPLQHPLIPSAQRALNQLQSTHNLEDVNKRLKLANELLAECAGGINDQLRYREDLTRKMRKEAAGKENAPRSSQGGENPEDREENGEEEERRERQREKVERMETELEQLRTKVTTMTGRMDEHVRKVIDAQVRIGDIREILSKVKEVAGAEALENTQVLGTQRTQRGGRALDDDGDEEMDDEESGTIESFEPTLDGGRIQQSITAPSELFTKKLEQKKDDWQSLTLTTRYTRNNDYIGFKRLVHDAIHGDDGTPLPPPNKWFAKLEGRGSPAPGTQGAGAGSGDEESDDDIAIAREVLSTKCPLTLKEFNDPVTSTKCPHTFERDAIKQLIQESTTDVDGNPLRGRNRTNQAVNCPVGGCSAMLTVADLRTDPVLVRKIRRLQAAKKRAENEDDDTNIVPSSPAGRRKRTVDVESSDAEGERQRAKAEPRSSNRAAPRSTAMSTAIDLSEGSDED